MKLSANLWALPMSGGPLRGVEHLKIIAPSGPFRIPT